MAQQPAAEHVSCRRCKHYKISWDPNAPHGCEAMGFKSKKLPSLIVFQASGIECQMFAPKPSRLPTPDSRLPTPDS